MLLVALLLFVSSQTNAMTPAQPVPSVMTKPSLNTPIETLMANPKTKAVIDADLPTLAAHPSYEMFKGMSLNEVAPMSNGAMSDELLKKIAADLAAIK